MDLIPTFKDVLMSYNLEYWFPLAGSGLIHWSLGFTYTFGNLVPYIASYMTIKGRYGITICYICWIETIFMLFQGLFGYISGKLEQKLGFFIVLVLGVLLANLGLGFASYHIEDFLFFSFFYSIILGIAHGLIYPLTISYAINKYPAKMKGIISGILWGCRGLSMALLPCIQCKFLNPYSFRPDLKYKGNWLYSNTAILDRIPTMLYCMTLASFISQILGVLTIFYGESNIKFEKASSKKSSDAEETIETKYQSSNNKTNLNSQQISYSTSNVQYKYPYKILSSSYFKLLWYITFCTWPAVLYTQVYWKIHGMHITTLRDFQLARIACFIGILHTISRLIWGLICEAFGPINSLCIMTSFFISGLLVFAFPLWEPFIAIQYTLGYSLLSVAHAGTFVVPPSTIIKVFGAKNFGPIFGLLFSARILSSTVFCLVISLIFKYSKLEYIPIIILFSSFVGFFLTIYIRDIESQEFQFEGSTV
ncbi:uncharacterized protein CMU_034520 [Cryptosporidium muris RN66]|uniref:Major facilitator superfamily protein n=1 Tax=Cryptosporidium muris (strain RN66) TaxID=441375 RepID=B6AFS5_CRYMR|nr:uncharacterized protein CMU_034520 [Cryptosporidium muris RN66]EEA07066.1 hypothetical protein, conserved [Cryptosporidium muris RN66]|eukprot:XP_002141415.1 hypothetical protein [Cryptosporidium muris RN66]